jgi:hypothetical protein
LEVLASRCRRTGTSSSGERQYLGPVSRSPGKLLTDHVLQLEDIDAREANGSRHFVIPVTVDDLAAQRIAGLAVASGDRIEAFVEQRTRLPGEPAAVLKRRDALVAPFDAQIAERGRRTCASERRAGLL